MALNPSLLRMATPETPFDLHLPAGAAALFNDRIGQIPETRRSSWRYHRVIAEDTLASVAREYRVSESELAGANQLHATDSLQGSRRWSFPSPLRRAFSPQVLYTARRGDTLVTIADRFGVSLSQLRLWNHMAGTKVDPGRRLHVAEPALAVSSSRRHHASSSASGPLVQSRAPSLRPRPQRRRVRLQLQKSRR